MPNTRRRKAGGTRKRGKRVSIGGLAPHKKVSTSVKQYVNNAISKSAETKMIISSVAVPVNCSSVISPSNVRSLIPIILQGTGEGYRIGNKITIRKVILRGYITLQTSSISPYGLTYPTQFNCKMFIGRTKYSAATAPVSGDMSRLLRSGAGATDFGQDLLSLMKPVNKDYWTVSNQRTFKLGMSSGAGTNIQTTGYANNDYNLTRMFKIDITRAYRKTWRYNDNANYPENTGLFIFAGATDLIGSNIAYGQVAGISAECEIYYDDE